MLTNDEHGGIIRIEKVAKTRQERIDNMLNVQKLKGKIVENGKTIEGVSADIGISPSTFYRKMNNNSFEIGEADKLVRILGLSCSEATAIFFSQVVA